MRSIIYVILFISCFSLNLFGQNQGLFKYQAVARDAQGQLYQNQQIYLKTAIIQDHDNNEQTVFEEEHIVVTSERGLFSLNIGGGFAPYGDMENIDWATGQYYLNVQMALEGEQYTDMGNSPILAVPLALHAKTAENVDDADADPTNELQHLAIADNKLLISGGNHVDISNWASPWTATNAGISYKSGKVDINLLQTLGVEASIGNNHTVLNGNGLELKQNDISNSAKLSRTSLRMESGTKMSDLTGHRLLFSNINSSELNENELKINGSNQGRFTNLNNTTLSFTETINFRRKMDVGLNGLSYESKEKKLTLDATSLKYYGKIGRDNAELMPNYLRFTDNDENNNATFSRNGAVVNASNGGSSLTGTKLNFRVAAQPQKSSNMNIEGVQIEDNKLKTDLQGGHLRLTNDKTTSFTQMNGDVLQLYSSNRQRLKLSSNSEGRLELFNGSGRRAIHMETKNSAGHITLEAGNGRPTIQLTTNNNRAGNGYIGMFNYEGRLKGSWFTDTWSNAGSFYLYGANGTKTVVISNTPTETSSGRVDLYDDRNVIQLTLGIDNWRRGFIATDIKNFKMDHPTKPNKEIWYASIEGPEAAAYERGTGQLKNGEIFIPYSDHFKLVGNHETVTVILTPLSADTRGLAVIEKAEGGFRVKELMGGQGNFKFDWEVKAVRKGFEDFQVIRDKEIIKEDSKGARGK